MSEPGAGLDLPPPPMQEPPPDTYVEYQIVRLDSTVVFTIMVHWTTAVRWEPAFGFEIDGPVAGRFRVLPAGPWLVRAYYPDGYPGRTAPWPEDAALTRSLKELTG